MFFYSSAYNIIRNSIIEIRLQEINRFAIDMDKNMYDVYKLIYSLESSFDLSKVVANDQNTYYCFKEVEAYIKRSIAANPFVEEMLFYHEYSDTVITSEGSFKFDEYFDKYMSNSIQNKYFWRDYFEKSYNSKVLPSCKYLSETFDGQTYTKDLIAILTDKSVLPGIRVVIFVKAETIGKWYGNDILILEYETGVPIYDGLSERVNISDLSSNLPDVKDAKGSYIKLNNDDLYVFYNKSQYYPWYYIKLMKQSGVFGKLDKFNLLSLLIVFAMLMMGIFLSYFFSRSLYKPIKRVVDFINIASKYSKNDSSRNEVQGIYNYIQHLYDNFEQIEYKYNAIQEIYKQFLYEKIMNNVNLNEELLKELNVISSSFENYFVIYYNVFHSSKTQKSIGLDENKYNMISITIKELIDITLKKMEIKSCSFEIKHDCYIIIVMDDRNKFDRVKFESSIKKILENDLSYLYITFSFSCVYHDIQDLKTAYENVLNLSGYRSLREELQFIYNDSREETNESFINKNLIERAELLVESGKADQLKILLCEVFDKFCEKDTPIIYIRQYFTYIFRGLFETAEKEAKTEMIDKIYKKINACSSRNDFIEVISLVCSFVTDNSGSGTKDNTSQSVIDCMIKYIREDYANDLYLNFFADKFKMSPIYLSKLFKDCSGENFSNYLKKVRLEKAKELLLQSDYRIKYLAEKVGYNDTNTFIKAFKSYFKMTPGEYRKLSLSKVARATEP